MSSEIKIKEQQRMDNVISEIKKAEAKHQKDLKKVEADQAAIKDDFVNNLRIKTETYTGMMETALTVRQQQQLLSERENNWKQATQQLDVLQKLAKKPYFARIDIQEKGEAKPETIYIGLGSFAKDDEHFLVYDWRAPISSVYYDGSLGQVQYETPDGMQSVDLNLKRQFVVEDGTIITIFDTDEAVGDQMLLDVLDDNSDTKMKSIVTTIQKEQNKIIRDTKSELLFVQGAAGSGKTSAVLQRVAYLLYRYRGKLTSSQIVLFSPNQLFNDYIDQVLPELGEQNMVQMTYYQYTQRRLPQMHVETLQERFMENQDPTQQKITAVKDSLAFFDATTAYTEYLEHKGMRFKDIYYQGEILFPKAKIRQIYYSFNENYHLRNRLQATKEALMKILSSKIGQIARTDEVQKEVQSLSREELQSLYGDQSKEFVNGDKEMLFLAKQYVMQQFIPVRNLIMKGQFLNLNLQYIRLLKSVPSFMDLDAYGLTQEQWTNHIDATIESLKARKITMSDVTPYLYLFDCITGQRGEVEIKHLFIDEIQDYTAYQLAYLKTKFPRAKFTMLGDLNQAIFTHENSQTLLEELSTLFPTDKTKVIQLTKSYRSTQQITDFTKEILVGGEQVTSFARKGEMPTITISDNNAKLVQACANQIKANEADNLTTAVIAKTLAECEILTKELQAQGLHVTLIRTENQRLVPGTIIVPAYLAKGLEFDAVVMWNANRANYTDNNEQQLVYTICSRAMHRLSIFAQGELSPLLQRVSPELYELKKI